MARPRMAEATHVAATVANSSTVAPIVEWPNRFALRVGAPLPATTIAVTIADCKMANAQNTALLASR